MPVHFFPPSVDFHTTMLVLYSVSGSLGSTIISGASPPPILASGLPSSVISCQLSPASSERYNPMPDPVPYSFASVVPTATYITLGAEGARAIWACAMFLGKSFVSFFHVVPPSVDLKTPPFVPAHSP